MNKQRASTGAKKQQAISTDFDDWETDPDYIRDIDEMDQRWGSRRTVGSINMNDLIEQVNREHKSVRDKFQHPSQRLRNPTDEKITTTTTRDPIHGYEERMSKQSSTQEITRKVYTSTSGSESGTKTSFSPVGENDTIRSFTEKTTTSKPNIAIKPDFVNYSRPTSTSPLNTSTFTATERKTSETNDRSPRVGPMPQALKSIQDKIDAFKKEFEGIESKVARKSDITKVIKKTSNYETKKSSSDPDYVQARNSDYTTLKSTTSAKTKSHEGADSFSSDKTPSWNKSTFATVDEHLPKADIEGLSKHFETLCRESEDNFKRRIDAKRMEFFDQIKHQVRETRKNLDGFDPIDCDDDEVSYAKPKVYTKCETTKEEVVSKIVKENDKIVENETKRNFEHDTSCHGSSDDEAGEPTSIKYLNQHISKSPTEYIRTESPIDEIKRKVPVIETEVKGAGLMARTLYEYQAAEDDELTFEVDELITNIDKVSEDWYRGTITKGGRRITGLFPANYVKLLNDSGNY